MPVYAGLDMGKTKIAVGLVDVDSGKVLDSVVEATDWSRGGDRMMAQAERLCQQLLNGTSRDVRGLGIGTFALLDYSRGVVVKSLIDSWEGYPIVASFESALGVPVRVSTDVEVAALGEALFGGGADLDPFVYMTVSTGVGVATLGHGVVWHGAHSLAGHIAHIRLPSGLFIDQALGGKGIETRVLADTGKALACREIFSLAKNGGDARIAAIVDDARDALTLILAFVQEIVDPEGIVIGGSVAVNQPDWVDSAVKRLAAMTELYQVQLPHGPAVRLSAMGGENAIVGAACLFARRT